MPDIFGELRSVLEKDCVYASRVYAILDKPENRQDAAYLQEVLIPYCEQKLHNGPKPPVRDLTVHTFCAGSQPDRPSFALADQIELRVPVGISPDYMQFFTTNAFLRATKLVLLFEGCFRGHEFRCASCEALIAALVTKACHFPQLREISIRSMSISRSMSLSTPETDGQIFAILMAFPNLEEFYSEGNRVSGVLVEKLLNMPQHSFKALKALRVGFAYPHTERLMPRLKRVFLG